jgi:hypothetical protein
VAPKGVESDHVAPECEFVVKQVQAVVREFGLEAKVVIWGPDTTFPEQVATLADTGLLISMHGAGLMNEIFLPPGVPVCASVCHCQFKFCAVASSLHRVHAGAAVIEIFPPHVKHVLYERIAHYVGVYHFKVYATQFPANFGAKNPTYFSKGCDKIPSMDVADDAFCWLILKNVPIIPPIDDLRTAIANALEFLPAPKAEVSDAKTSVAVKV